MSNNLQVHRGGKALERRMEPRSGNTNPKNLWLALRHRGMNLQGYHEILLVLLMYTRAHILRPLLRQPARAPEMMVQQLLGLAANAC